MKKKKEKGKKKRKEDCNNIRWFPCRLHIITQ